MSAFDQQLATLVRDAFGQHRRVAAAERIERASKKGVYRLRFDDATTAILYRWDAAENYSTGGVDPADPLADASGADLFEAAHASLHRLGIGTPEVYLLDRSRRRCPYDAALVEDVAVDLTALQRRDPGAAQQTLAVLGADLARLHQQRGPRPGKVALVDAGTAAGAPDCPQVVTGRAHRDLTEAAAHLPPLAAAADELAHLLLDLAAAVAPRTAYGLIHGELDPGHVRVGAQGRPLLIDFEGLMYFDVEWEHVFLRWRYGHQYRLLRGDQQLDPLRMRLYRLAMHLSLVAGPLRLIAAGHPAEALLSEIVDSNLREALAIAHPSSSGR